MDVAGVALATIISQCISACLVIRCLIHEREEIRLDLKKLRLTPDKFRRILRIGLPAGLQGTLFSLSNVVIQSSVNSFGAVIVAGNSAAQNIEGFGYTAMNAFHQAAISFTSQNMGAGKYNRINKILYTAQVYVFLVGLGFSMLVLFFGESLVGLYTNSPAVVDAGMVRLKYIVTLYFLCGMMDVMVGSLRGLGYAIMPMIVSLIGACGLRLVWIATVFKIPEFHTIEMIYITYPVSWFLTFVAHVVCFMVVRRRLTRVSV
jgi:Na+-driven multidrug efflux pump